MPLIKITKIGISIILTILFFIPWITMENLIGFDIEFSPFQIISAALALSNTLELQDVPAIFLILLIMPILSIVSIFLTKYRAVTMITGIYALLMIIWFTGGGGGFESLVIGGYLMYVASIALIVISFFKNQPKTQTQYYNHYPQNLMSGNQSPGQPWPNQQSPFHGGQMNQQNFVDGNQTNRQQQTSSFQQPGGHHIGQSPNQNFQHYQNSPNIAPNHQQYSQQLTHNHPHNQTQQWQPQNQNPTIRPSHHNQNQPEPTQHFHQQQPPVNPNTPQQTQQNQNVNTPDPNRDSSN